MESTDWYVLYNKLIIEDIKVIEAKYFIYLNDLS
jgi:hypothetical protein